MTSESLLIMSCMAATRSFAHSWICSSTSTNTTMSMRFSLCAIFFISSQLRAKSCLIGRAVKTSSLTKDFSSVSPSSILFVLQSSYSRENLLTCLRCSACIYIPGLTCSGPQCEHLFLGPYWSLSASLYHQTPRS